MESRPQGQNHSSETPIFCEDYQWLGTPLSEAWFGDGDASGVQRRLCLHQTQLRRAHGAVADGRF